jgi:hypothetical protein
MQVCKPDTKAFPFTSLTPKLSPLPRMQVCKPDTKAFPQSFPKPDTKAFPKAFMPEFAVP